MLLLVIKDALHFSCKQDQSLPRDIMLLQQIMIRRCYEVSERTKLIFEAKDKHLQSWT